MPFWVIYGISTVVCVPVITRVVTELDSRYRRWRGRPALVPYWIPYIGNAIEFGMDPLAFFAKYEKKYGPVISIKFFSMESMYVLDPAAFPAILRERPVMHEVMHRAFGVSDGAAAVERTGQADYKNHLMGRGLIPLGISMSYELDAAIHESISSKSTIPGERITVGLCDFILHVMFQAGVETLFGRGGYTRERFEAFAKLDDCVGPLISGIPKALLGLRRARDVLWNKMFSSEDIRGRDAMSALIRERSMHSLRSYKDLSDVQGVLISLLWGSQTNAPLSVFWLVAHLVTDAALFSTIQKEVLDACEKASLERHVPQHHLVPSDVDQKDVPILNAAVTEILRMYSFPASFRRVLHDSVIRVGGKDWHIPKQATLAIWHASLHWNEEIFPNPHRFDPSRWLDDSDDVVAAKTRKDSACDVEESSAEMPRVNRTDTKMGNKGVCAQRAGFTLHGVPLSKSAAIAPFGGGLSICPGRFFALQEAVLAAIALIQRCDIELVPGETLPKMKQRRPGAGIQPPERDMFVRIRLK